jgi:hypothetical protein
MSKKDRLSQPGHPNRHEGKGQEPMRVASRLKGVVKNLGIKESKKPKQEE